MPAFASAALKRQLKIGIVLAVLGLASVVGGSLKHDPQGFAASYFDGFRGVGWMALLFGCVWVAFSVAHLKTRFFDLDRRIDAEVFGISLAVIAGGVILLMVLVLPRLPATPPNELPPDPKMRETIVMQERNFRLFVAAALLACGAAVAAVPAVRFFRK